MSSPRFSSVDPGDVEAGDGLDQVGLTTATARAAFGAPDSTGRARRVAERLAGAIKVGMILDGERLPPETQLAVELGTATVTLREALALLRQWSLVETRRGRGGGTFVRSVAAGDSDAQSARSRLLGQQLLIFSVHDLRELGDHRRALLAMSAALAAERSVQNEKVTLRRRLDRLAVAQSASDRRRADNQLLVEVGGAAQSSVLAHEELRLQARIGDLLWWKADDRYHALVVEKRRCLVEAIALGRSGQARSIAEESVIGDTERLIGLRLALYGGDVQ